MSEQKQLSGDELAAALYAEQGYLVSHENPSEIASLADGLSTKRLPPLPSANASEVPAANSKPIVIDLFSGLFGWGSAFAAEGYRVIGFDLHDMCKELGKPRPEGCQLVLQDVLTLHGKQFRDAAVIVASPPCQEYSYLSYALDASKADCRCAEGPRRVSRELQGIADH